MKRILLVGATGQLGTAIFEELIQNKNFATRIFIREDARYDHLKHGNPEIVFGDLKNRESIQKAINGCDIIITTANSAAPRKKEDSFQKVDIDGFRNLIDEAQKEGVEQFIYTSILPIDKRFEAWVPIYRSKAMTETYLRESGLNYTIFQPDTFMDVYFTFLGTSIPVKGEPAALVNRPFPFMQNFYNGIKDDIDNGKIGIIGEGTAKHHYIAIKNVADFIVNAIDHPALVNKTIPIGGPEALSSLEVKAILEDLLEKPLKIKRTPTMMMKLMGNVFSLFNEGASNIFKLNYLAATTSTAVDCTALAQKLGIDLMTAEEYLRAKIHEEEFVDFG